MCHNINNQTTGDIGSSYWPRFVQKFHILIHCHLHQSNTRLLQEVHKMTRTPYSSLLYAMKENVDVCLTDTAPSSRDVMIHNHSSKRTVMIHKRHNSITTLWYTDNHSSKRTLINPQAMYPSILNMWTNILNTHSPSAYNIVCNVIIVDAWSMGILWFGPSPEPH